MRGELRRMIEQNRSDREILDAFVAKYGKRVLLEPEGGARAMIYVIPVIASGLGIALVVWMIRRWLGGNGRTADQKTS